MKSILTLFFCSFLMVCFHTFSCSEPAPDEGEFEKVIGLVEKRDYSRAVEALEALIPKLKEPDAKSRYCYLAATCYRNLENWKEAISYYKLALDNGEYMFADLAKFHIGRIYQRQEDCKSAVQWYEALLNDHPDSAYAIEARYKLGECCFASEQYDQAIRYYTEFAGKYPKDSRVRMAEYNTGQAYQQLEKWSDAYIHYQKLIRQDAQGELAQSSLEKIISLVSSHPEIAISMEDRMYHGLVMYYARKYKDAREELRKVIEESADLSPKAAYFIAESYYQERQYSAAIREYTSVIKHYPENDYVLSSQYQIALCNWKAGNQKEANDLFAKFAREHPESALADNAEFQIAENYVEKARYKEAVDAYGKVVDKYPSSSLADDSLWNMGWYYRKLKDNDKSEGAFRRLIGGYPDSNLSGAARFWIGANYEAMSKWQPAIDAYKEVIRNNDWYYSDRARQRLESLVKRGKADKEAIPAPQKIRENQDAAAWQKIRSPLPVRAQELLNLKIFDDAVGELLAAIEKAESLESIYYNLAVSYEKTGDFSNSWKYGWRLLNMTDIKKQSEPVPLRLQRMSYPAVYKEAVLKNSRENKVDPLLMLALMLEESRYDPVAVSWAGARGLTQIMPPTGRDIADRLKIQPFNTEMLFLPELNIRMGTWYLSGIITRFDTRVRDILNARSEDEYSDITRILALGAYNAGESRVRRWVTEYGISDIDEFVENIPIGQTKQYIKKVCDSYERYKFFYSEGIK